MAELVGLASEEIYGRIERGVMLPSVPTLHRLALVLEVSTDHLLDLGAEERPALAPVTPEEDLALRRLIRKARY